MSIFEIVKAIATFSTTTLLQVFKESIVSCVARSDDFNIDLLLVFNVKDYISMLFVFFNLLVCCLTNIGYCYSGCLLKLISTPCYGNSLHDFMRRNCSTRIKTKFHLNLTLFQSYRRDHRNIGPNTIYSRILRYDSWQKRGIKHCEKGTYDDIIRGIIKWRVERWCTAI